MKIKELLDKKGYGVYDISPEAKVSGVVDILVRFNIGDVLVLDHRRKLVGIVSERDVIRKCIHQKRRLDDVTVSEIMTKDVIVAFPEDDLEYVLGLMTQNRIRHVPIIKKEGDLVGLVSIGDLVKGLLHEKEVENRYLRDYISGP